MQLLKPLIRVMKFEKEINLGKEHYVFFSSMRLGEGGGHVHICQYSEINWRGHLAYFKFQQMEHNTAMNNSIQCVISQLL